MRGDLTQASHWLAKGQNDLLNADNNLAAQRIPSDTVCFHCQQAAEKFLKAFLIARGTPYPFTHDLLLLLEHVLPLDASAEALRDCLAVLMPYAVEVRYPDDGFMPALSDCVEAREAAGQVLAWLEGAAPSIFS